MKIVKAEPSELNACVAILLDSYLGEFISEEVAQNILQEGLKNGEVYVGKDDSQQIVGFFRLVQAGAFLYFPYLHLLVIRAGYRGSGLGTQCLKEIEKIVLADKGFPPRKKSFLLVGEPNRHAKKFYEKNGYREVGPIENMFGEGDTEILMVKDFTPS